MSAALEKTPDPRGFDEALSLAKTEVDNPDPKERAWAYGTLAELTLLGLYHKTAKAAPVVSREVGKHCREIVELTGSSSFQVKSTLRQFLRYRDHWSDPRWDKAVQAAIKALED